MHHRQTHKIRRAAGHRAQTVQILQARKEPLQPDAEHLLKGRLIDVVLLENHAQPQRVLLRRKQEGVVQSELLNPLPDGIVPPEDLRIVRKNFPQQQTGPVSIHIKRRRIAREELLLQITAAQRGDLHGLRNQQRLVRVGAAGRIQHLLQRLADLLAGGGAQTEHVAYAGQKGAARVFVGGIVGIGEDRQAGLGVADAQRHLLDLRVVFQQHRVDSTVGKACRHVRTALALDCNGSLQAIDQRRRLPPHALICANYEYFALIHDQSPPFFLSQRHNHTRKHTNYQSNFLNSAQ